MNTLSCALFPAPCTVCGSPLLRLTSAPVCDSCWNSLECESGFWCLRCGEDLGVFAIGQASIPLADQVCRPCRLSPPPFRRAVAFGVYRETLRALIHALKFDGMLPVADGLGKRLAQATLYLEGKAPRQMLVVPVPLHSLKHRTRQFNHAELLARAALRHLRVARPEWQLTLAPSLLERKRATGSQSGLSPHERRVNVRGAFFAPQPELLRGQHVLLIDDIYTTGATARACTAALLKAGAASVWVATVARAQFELIRSAQHKSQDKAQGRYSEMKMDAEDLEARQAELPMQEDIAFWDAKPMPAAPTRVVH